MAYFRNLHQKLAYSVSCEQKLRSASHALHSGVSLRTLAFALVSVTVSTGAYGGTVNCNNGSGDASAIQNAINSGGIVTISGSCSLGRTGLSIGSNVTINGTAALNYSGSGWLFNSSGNNNTINGLTLNGGGINLTAGHSQGGWTITNNTIQNITNGANGLNVANILATSGGIGNTISNNTFRNIWGAPGGYPNYPAGYNAGNCNNTCIGGGGINVWGGIDHTTIDNNLFDKMGEDGAYIAFNEVASADQSWGFQTTNNVVSNNVCTHGHRFCLEMQGVSDYPSSCVKSQCQFGVPYTSGVIVKNNLSYQVDGALAYDVYGFSLVMGGSDGQIINNTALYDSSSCVIRPGIALEMSNRNMQVQGNVFGSVNSKCGWIVLVAQGAGVPNTGVNTYQNNILCTANATYPLAIGDDNTRFPNTIDQYNAWSSTCSSVSIGASNITVAFTSSNNQSFAGGDSGTWNVYAGSTLSLKHMKFFIDGSATAAVTQEIQDLNTNFASDRKWLYHATVNTANLGSGSHTITAKATDVSGATQSVTQNFVVANAGMPVVQLNPAALSFGSQTQGLTTNAQAVTVTNSGTAALAIGGLTITGSNASDFLNSSTCGSSLAVGGSCAIHVTFTPSAAGSRTAALSLSDNASDSIQTISLSGTGAPAIVPGPPSLDSTSSINLPKNLPTGMILWLATDSGVVRSENGVIAWDDQSGSGNNAVQPNTANQPTLVAGNNGQSAMHFNGASSYLSIPSLPINGKTGLTVFVISANSTDHAAGYGQYAFLYWPETGSWGSSFFGSYQTSSHFRFGTLQTGNESVYQMPFTRTNSFGLSEWMHSGATDSMWLNGQSIASYTGKVQSINGVGDTALLGQGINNTFYAGDISELIIYARALTASERAAVEQYLMNKYHL